MYVVSTQIQLMKGRVQNNNNSNFNPYYYYFRFIVIDSERRKQSLQTPILFFSIFMNLLMTIVLIIIQMSDVNSLPPLQLIRLRDNIFEVPEETKTFLRELKNPLGVISIVGKYRTGKSLFLNKVLLKKSSFKVSPTINSCTKGLWMCRETLRSEGSEEMDILVIDTEGFGATEQTDAYNNKILLFAILLSSYFVYNSVGSIDQTSINNLNVIANLARDIQKSNSKDDKLEEEFPSFLWLVRDFSLNMVDKNGCPIQPKEYLEQALQILKGNSDAIQNKNKVRRMIKHFFKDRDCCTLVRPVQTESQLQMLYYLSDQELRPQFIEQAYNLRSKIMKKVKPKRIRGKALDGQTLLELALSYVDVINKGTLPNFDSSYKLIMRFHLNKLADQFMQSCKQQFQEFTKQMRTKEDFDQIIDNLNQKVEQKFREGAFQAEQTKLITEKLKKDIRKFANAYMKQNEEKIMRNCKEIWESLYEQIVFEDEMQIRVYFEGIGHKLKEQLKNAKNPVDESYYTILIEEERCKQLQFFIKHRAESTTKNIMSLEHRNAELQSNNSILEIHLRELKDNLFEANRQLTALNSRYTQLQRTKEQEIGHLRQRECDHLKELEKYHYKTQQYEKQVEHLHKNCTDVQERLQQSQRNIRQLTQEKRLLQSELDIVKTTLQNRSDEVVELKMKLGETINLLNGSRERQTQLETRSKVESQTYEGELKQTQLQNQKLALELNQCAKRISALDEQLRGSSQSIARERTIYENMFNSFKQSLKSEEISRQQLIQTNKNLSSALKHLENRAIQAQQKEKQLKQYKRCVKNSSCLQCQHCTKFFVPSIFVPHLNVCLIGPDALKSAQVESETGQKKLEIKIKQTLIREDENKPYTQYVIDLKRGNQCWTIERKYKAFCNLNSTLHALLPGVELSDVSHIVSPQQFTKKSSLAIQQRRRALEKYMIDLSMNPLVTATSAWREFIEEGSVSVRNSPLKQNKEKENKKYSNASNNEPTPEQFLKVWNERKLRGKELTLSKKFKPNC